jgi:hypothetical protein
MIESPCAYRLPVVSFEHSRKGIIMPARGICLIVLLFISLLAAGCTTCTTAVRQDDGTYRTTRHMIWKPSAEDYTTFESDKDYMISTTWHGVTYEWPRGKSTWTSLTDVKFQGASVECHITKRALTVNGKSYGEMKEGTRVRLTGEGEVYVDGVKRPPLVEG